LSPRRRLSDVRRQQILDAAVQVIGERGICDARIADVAARAGASSGLVLYYFKTKDRLLADALRYQDQRFYEQVASRLERIPKARDRLILMIEATCPPEASADLGPAQVDEWVLWLDMWHRARHDPDIAKDREELDRTWREVIARTVREGQAEGAFGTADPEEFALRLTALIDGLAIQVILDDPTVTPARMREVCLRVAASELGFALPRRKIST
jgi:AcrR family transcriptional regulator